MKGFRAFLARGSLIELATAVVVGSAFTALVSALVADLITPLIAAIGRKPNFSNLYFTLNHSKFLYGSFINAILSFLIVSAVVYFLILAPIARLSRHKTATERPCPECLSKIPVAATRCAFCTSEVQPASAG